METFLYGTGCVAWAGVVKMHVRCFYSGAAIVYPFRLDGLPLPLLHKQLRFLRVTQAVARVRASSSRKCLLMLRMTLANPVLSTNTLLTGQLC